MTNLAAAVELKACAHCAHDRTYFDKDWPSDHVGYYLSLRCSQCKAGTRSIHCYEDDPMVYQELRDLWNTRPPVAGLAELTDEQIVCLYDAMNRAEVLNMKRRENALGQMRGVDKAVIEAAREFLGKVDG